MTHLSDIIADHAPYLSKRSDNALCLRCLDHSRHGEFASSDAWAGHVADELKKAGYRRR